MRLIWDPIKSEANRRKHGVSFEEAGSLLMRDGSIRLDVYDLEHSDAEDRFNAIGAVARGLIVLVYTEPEEGVFRLISARMATTSEERQYIALIRGNK
jgi:uncharacterized protein